MDLELGRNWRFRRRKAEFRWCLWRRPPWQHSIRVAGCHRRVSFSFSELAVAPGEAAGSFCVLRFQPHRRGCLSLKTGDSCYRCVMPDDGLNRWHLPDHWSDLPWRRINWALHIAWAIVLLLLLNSCGRARNIDAISISLTILQIVIAIALVGGFWILRPEVKETARNEARETALHEARRAVEEWRNATTGGPENIQGLADALDKEDADDAANR